MIKTTRAEKAYIKKYWEEVQAGKFPVICNTVDSVVFLDGKVLLIQRKNKPGAGTWAVPGGFINQYEPLFDAAVREFHEETGIFPQKEWLFDKDVIDTPHRAPGGRIITHAYGFIIPVDNINTPMFDKQTYLSMAEAGDDAAALRWVGRDNFVRNFKDICHQDHFEIVMRFAAGFHKSKLLDFDKKL